MSRICLYFRRPPEGDRWVRGDRYVRPFIRRIVRGPPRPGGIERVFLNLCAGLDRLGVSYEVNLPFAALREGDRVGVLGVGRHALEGYDRPNPIVAGIGLMDHPSQWPTLFDEFPVSVYLQHSAWARDVYQRWFGDRCGIWPVGIDTDLWSPDPVPRRDVDVLIYEKFRWNEPEWTREYLDPLRATLASRGLRTAEMHYGPYRPEAYRKLLRKSRAMIFLCTHESQGLAYQECLSTDVPILAWDPGSCLDPSRFQWGEVEIPATSVPYWDDRCGERFRDASEMLPALDRFLEKVDSSGYAPRQYILENLTIEKSARAFLDFLEDCADGGGANFGEAVR